MAKKKKHKETAAEPAPAPAQAKSDQPIDVAFAAGNYAAVRAMAKSDLGEKVKMLTSLVTIDRVQVAIGVATVALLLLIALLTLK